MMFSIGAWSCVGAVSVRICCLSASRCCIGNLRSIISQQYSAYCDSRRPSLRHPPIVDNLSLLSQNIHFSSFIIQANQRISYATHYRIHFSSISISRFSLYFCVLLLQPYEKVQPLAARSLDSGANLWGPLTNPPPPRPTLSYSLFDEVSAICAFNYEYIQLRVILTWLDPPFLLSMCEWVFKKEHCMLLRMLEICKCHVLFDCRPLGDFL